MSSKINILYTSSFASMQGGGQRSTYLLVKYLNRNEFNPIFVVPGEGELSKIIKQLGVKTFRCSFTRLKSFNIYCIIRDLNILCNIIKDNNIDIIHVESPKQLFYAALIKKITGVSVIMHLRVSESSPWLDRLISRSSDCIIAVSNFTATRMKTICSKDKTKIIYNGVELDKFSPKQSSCGQGPLRVGFFGRIHPSKGVDILIKAAKKLNSKVDVNIWGDGNSEYLKELKKLAEGFSVKFCGYKYDIINDIADVDVVVLPSIKNEGLSRILIESMAMGKIVIASNVASNLEAMGSDLEEFIFSKGNYLRLSQLLDKICNNRDIIKEKEGMIRKRAEKLFDIRESTLKIEEVYNSILKNKL